MSLILKKRLPAFSDQKAIGLILSFCLLGALPAQAEYQPPSEPSAPSGGTSTAGTRGGRGSCADEVEGSLTVLAPLSYAGQTTSTRPAFLWYVADTQPYPLEFRLYQQVNEKRQLLQKIKMQSQPGLMQVTLPNSQSELKAGQLYSWQVVLVCNPNHPSRDVVAGATIQVVPLPSALQAQLSTAKSSIDRANLYAKNGFWYDAMAQVSQPNPAPSVKQLQISLLSDLAKSEKETPEFQAMIREQKKRLNHVAGFRP